MSWWIEVIAADLLVIFFGFCAVFGFVWLFTKLLKLCFGGPVGDASNEVHDWNPERQEPEE